MGSDDVEEYVRFTSVSFEVCFLSVELSLARRHQQDWDSKSWDARISNCFEELENDKD